MSKVIHGIAAALVAAAFLSFNLLTDNPASPRWGSVQALAVILICVWTWRVVVARQPLIQHPETTDFLTASFLFWCALSLLWALDPREGALQFVNMVSLAVIFASGQRAAAQWFAPTIAATSLGALAFYLHWPAFWGGFGNENFLTEFLMIALPWALAAPPWLGIPAFLGGVYWLFFVSNSDTVWAGLLALGSVALVAMWMFRRRFWAVVLVLSAVNAALLSGWAVSYELMRALAARFELTYNTGVMWLQSPIAGHGVGSFNFLYPLFQERHLDVWPAVDTTLRPMTVFAGAAHNEYAQALSELGLVGALLACAIVAAISCRLRRRRLEWSDLCALSSMIIAAAVMAIGFPLHNPHTALLIVLGLSFLARRGESLASSRERWPWRSWERSDMSAYSPCAPKCTLALLARFTRATRHSLYTAMSKL